MTDLRPDQRHAARDPHGDGAGHRAAARALRGHHADRAVQPGHRESVRAAGRRGRGVHRGRGRRRHQHRAAARCAGADPVARGGHPAPAAAARRGRRGAGRRHARLCQPGPARRSAPPTPRCRPIPSPTSTCSQSQEDIGIPNTVTSVLASYRGLDTLGELVVVFTAGVAVLSLLGPLAPGRQRPEPGTDVRPRRLPRPARGQPAC